MKTFKLEIFDGHAFIEHHSQIILIDTGSPVSVHKEGILQFNGINYDCSPEYLGLTVSELSSLIGREITTLMGMDILSKFKILVDYNSSEITFSRQHINFSGNEIRLDVFMCIPLIKATVNNETLNLLLDTGAKISYLNRLYTSSLLSLITLKDFIPGIGNFSTPCYHMNTYFGSTSFPVVFGNLPPILETSLMLGNVNGIIGSDLFTNFKVMLDFEEGRLRYCNYQNVQYKMEF